MVQAKMTAPAIQNLLTSEQACVHLCMSCVRVCVCVCVMFVCLGCGACVCVIFVCTCLGCRVCVCVTFVCVWMSWVWTLCM